MRSPRMAAWIIGLTTLALVCSAQTPRQVKVIIDGASIRSRPELSAEILDMEDKLGTLEAGKLADVIVVGGRPDESLDDLAQVHTVVRDGYLVVEGGQVVIPRHEPLPPPKPKERTGILP